MRLPVTVRLGNSNYSTALAIAAHGIAVAAIVPLDLAWPLRLILAGLIAISLPISLVRLYRREVYQLYFGVRDGLDVESKVGARRTLSIDPQTTILPGCIVLCLREAGQLIVMPVFADAMDDASFRRLRLWLRQRADS